MKFIWEKADIQVGRRVIAHNRTEEWMIGYEPLIRRETGTLILVSLLDGMVAVRGQTASQMAEHLNAGCNRPLDLRLEKDAA